MISKLLRKIVGKIYWMLSEKDPRQRVVCLKAPTPQKGNVLLSYVLEPFFLKDESRIPSSHTHDWESFQMAKTFLSLGYNVDIIDYGNYIFTPQKRYDIFVAARTNFQRLSSHLNSDCIKIAHLDMAHWIFNNLAAYKRLWSFQQKKGISLYNIKFQEVNWAIECCDYAIVLGNQFTINTYQYAKKPIFRVPISTCATYPSPVDKDFSSCKGNFLWIGSSGLVHKGLDLVLDAFSDSPELHLFVVGPVRGEKDFEKAYYDELYNTPNIHTLGWMDVMSAEFIDILNKCIAVVYPSCAEGGGGSVVNCMHAGLIPIVSYEASVDVHDFGIILEDSSHGEIKNSIHKIAGMPDHDLKKMSLNAWEFANKQHTRENFGLEYTKVIKSIIDKHHPKNI